MVAIVKTNNYQAKIFNNSSILFTNLTTQETKKYSINSQIKIELIELNEQKQSANNPFDIARIKADIDSIVSKYFVTF